MLGTRHQSIFVALVAPFFRRETVVLDLAGDRRICVLVVVSYKIAKCLALSCLDSHDELFFITVVKGYWL